MVVAGLLLFASLQTSLSTIQRLRCRSGIFGCRRKRQHVNQTQPKIPFIDLNTVAFGFITGAAVQNKRIRALHNTYLPRLKNTLIMSDRADRSLGIEAVPLHYSCSGRRNFPELQLDATTEDRLRGKNNPTWGGYGRCTQLRFLYVLLELVRRFPPKTKEHGGMHWYAIVDDDTFIVPENLAKYIQNFESLYKKTDGSGGGGEVGNVMLGSRDTNMPNPDLLFGGLLLISSQAAATLAETPIYSSSSSSSSQHSTELLQGCASEFEFDTLQGCKPGSSAESRPRGCYERNHKLFVKCQSKIQTLASTQSLPVQMHVRQEVLSAKLLKSLPTECRPDKLVQEHGGPMYFSGTMSNNGQDHLMSWCIHSAALRDLGGRLVGDTKGHIFFDFPGKNNINIDSLVSTHHTSPAEMEWVQDRVTSLSEEGCFRLKRATVQRKVCVQRAMDRVYSSYAWW